MHNRRNITRESASNLISAPFLLPGDKRNGMLARRAFRRVAAEVANDEFVPMERQREQLNTGKVADEEMVLSAGKDFST